MLLSLGIEGVHIALAIVSFVPQSIEMRLTLCPWKLNPIFSRRIFDQENRHRSTPTSEKGSNDTTSHFSLQQRDRPASTLRERAPKSEVSRTTQQTAQPHCSFLNLASCSIAAPARLRWQEDMVHGALWLFSRPCKGPEAPLRYRS